MFKTFLLLSLISSTTAVSSQEIDPSVDHSLEISSVEVRPTSTPDEALLELPKVPTNPIDEIAMYIDGIIAIGKKIWPIIEAGKPVIKTGGLVPAISVIPSIDGAAAPTPAPLSSMANWSRPKVLSYRVSFKNGYNKEVIGFTYTVFFQYNGSYQEKGKYITSLKVQASEVNAAWGFNFDASSELISVANVGTTLDPVASAIIQITYLAKGLNSKRYEQSFYVDGAGALELITP